MKGEYRQQTTPVGQFPPNAFGLYDMHGNVWESCLDNWHDNYDGAPTDGSAWVDNDNRYQIMRGGSWLNYPANCRSAYRNDSLLRDVTYLRPCWFSCGVCGREDSLVALYTFPLFPFTFPLLSP